MGWDVYILKFEGPHSFERLDAENFVALSLGTAQEVRDKISARFPTVDWPKPDWGDLDENGYSIEFNIGREADVRNIMLHVRGGGNPVPAILRLCQANDWAALDGERFLEASPGGDQSWAEWQAYRDQIVGTLAR